MNAKVQLSPQQQADLASLAYELGHNPKTRRGLAKLVHEINPQRAAQSFKDVVQEEKFTQLERKIEEKLDLSGAKAAKAKQDAQKTKLAERYDEKQLDEIEAVMTRYGLSDYDAGAVLYSNENPQSDPTLRPPSGRERHDARWSFPTVPGPDGKPMDFKSFASDAKEHSLNTAYRMIDEFANKNLSPSFRR